MKRWAVGIVVAVGLAGAVVLLLATRESVWQGTVYSTSEIPWGGDVIAFINPHGKIIAETHYYPEQSHHFARALGQADERSFKAFVSHFDFEPLPGDLWNERLSKWPGNATGVLFSHDDTGFVGVIDKPGARTGVEGVFSGSLGKFFIELKSTD